MPMAARLFDAKVFSGRGSSSAQFVSFDIPAVEPMKFPIQLPAVLPKAVDSAVRKKIRFEDNVGVIPSRPMDKAVGDHGDDGLACAHSLSR